MRIAFIDRGKCWSIGDDGQYRSAEGEVYVEEQAANESGQRAITRNYEHVMLEFPDWKPSYPSEKAPYPHLVPSQRKGYFKGAMTSRREVEEFSARTGKRWGSP